MWASESSPGLRLLGHRLSSKMLACPPGHCPCIHQDASARTRASTHFANPRNTMQTKTHPRQHQQYKLPRYLSLVRNNATTQFRLPRHSLTRFSAATSPLPRFPIPPSIHISVQPTFALSLSGAPIHVCLPVSPNKARLSVSLCVHHRITESTYSLQANSTQACGAVNHFAHNDGAPSSSQMRFRRPGQGPDAPGRPWIAKRNDPR